MKQMSKSRTCPHCKTVMPLNGVFDKKMNLICPRCRKIVVPANRLSENDSRYGTAK